MKMSYKRVSTIDQNLDRQLAGLSFDREYIEKVSGKDINRPELKALLSNLRAGDEVHVHELSRLGRSVKDLLEIVQTVNRAGASLHFHQEHLVFTPDTSNPTSNLMLNMLGAIAQFERDMMLERQREGIAIAKAKGKYKGKKSKFSPEELQAMALEASESRNKTEVAKKYGVSRQYLYKLMNQAGVDQSEHLTKQ